MWMLLIVFLAVPGLTCDKGCVEFEGECACDAPTEKAPSVTDPAIVSDEKPSRHPEPAYQRGEVIADTPPSCAYTNDCSDQKAIDAGAEGKRKAGIK